MQRRLSRRRKNLVCMRQLARCAYCNRELCDAYEVDHANEQRTDDREIILVAACALCHAIKSRHVRLGRDWSHMRLAIENCRRGCLERWQQGVDYADFPEWLQRRITRMDVRAHELSVQAPPTAALDLEQYRYQPSFLTSSHDAT